MLLTLLPILATLVIGYVVWNAKFRKREEEPETPEAESEAEE